MRHPCHRSSSARKCGLWGRPSQNLLLGTSRHPLSGPYGKLMAASCWLETCDSRMAVHGTAMCCQSLGHLLPDIWGVKPFGAVPPSRARDSKFWYLRSARVLRWRVGSWQRPANMCRGSFCYSALFAFPRTGGLVPAWWASECLARKLTSHHASNWILPVFLSGARTLNHERSFLPYRSRYCIVANCKSSPSVPAVEIQTQIQIQRIVSRCKRRDSEHLAHLRDLWARGKLKS